MDNKLCLTPWGYYEVEEKPSKEELQEYYAERYYQREIRYQHHYDAEEMQYIKNQIERRYIVAQRLLRSDTKSVGSLLDVGCGEGWALQYFRECGWTVQGVDFSVSGVSAHNPSLVPQVIVGDVVDSLSTLVSQSRTFDVIWLDNVLEHVLDPFHLLKLCAQLAKSSSVLIVEVPNDFSLVQEALLSSGKVDVPYWVVIPDHISYFNQDGLVNICKASNWYVKTIMSDFPIEWYIFNEQSNYVRVRERGKAAHRARVSLDNLLHQKSPHHLIEMYEVFAKMGLGRSIVGFFHLGDL